MNTTGLQWVHSEIGARVNEARLAVEAHSNAPEQWQHMERCAQLVEQIHRVLAMVGVHGAAFLVEETAALARGLVERRVECDADTHEALMRSLVDLSGHLDRLRAGWSEHPLDLLEMVNDLRAARGAPLVSPGVLFSPALWSPLPEEASRPVQLRGELRQVVRRLRAYFESALLAVLRAGARGEREALQRIDMVLDRVEMLAAHRPALRLWWSARALVQDLAAGELELTVAVKRLLGQLDAQLGVLVKHGDAALESRPPAELMRHVLYYVAHSPVTGGRSAEVKVAFALDGYAENRSRGAESGGQTAALSAVAAPLAEQLDALQGELEACGAGDAEQDAAIAATVRQLAVTFGLLGADDLRESLRARAQELQDGVASGDVDRLLPLAEDLVRARTVVTSLTQARSKGAPDASEVAAIRYREALALAFAQVRTELFAVKEGLSSYAAAELDSRELDDVATGLERSLGVLRMLGDAETGRLRPWVDRLREAARHGAAALERDELERLADDILGAEAALEGDGAREIARARPAEAPRRESTPARVHVVEASPPPRPNEDAAVEDRGAASAGAETESDLDEDEEADEELREIFAEEMHEVIETLTVAVPTWTRDPSSRDALVEIRRAFHTLKGSGRVVGAMEIGDFAWSIEHVLNQIIEGSKGSSTQVGDLIAQATELLPEILRAFESRDSLPPQAGSLRDQATRLAA